MNKKIHIGFDPGKGGALVVIWRNGDVETFVFPLISGEYDISALNQLIKGIILDRPVHITIEDVKALQKPFDRGNWVLSRGKAILETIVVLNDYPHTLVSSKTWQKEMWQGIPEKRKPNTLIKRSNGVQYVKKGSVLTKDMSLLAVKKLFPTVDLRDPARKTERALAIHDGVVDALLLAEYSRRKFD